MAGVTSIEVKESLDERVQQLQQVETPTAKERLQVLYWLKQAQSPSLNAIANAIGKHRNTVGRWLLQYREGGVNAMLERKTPMGGVRKISLWAEAALAKRLKDPEHGFTSYGAIQQWLAEALGIEAEYHAIYQMTRYRLKAKLKAARPQNIKQNAAQRELFKKNSSMTWS